MCGLRYLLSIDSGAKPGYCLTGIETGVIIFLNTFIGLANSTAIPDWRQFPVSAIVIEGQEGHRINARKGPRVSANSIISLSFRAGFQLAEARQHWPTAECHILKPKDWKPAALPGRNTGNLPKDVFCNRLLARHKDLQMVLAGRDLAKLPEKRKQDLIDAFGIGRAWLNGERNPIKWLK